MRAQAVGLHTTRQRQMAGHVVVPGVEDGTGLWPPQ